MSFEFWSQALENVEWLSIWQVSTIDQITEKLYKNKSTDTSHLLYVFISNDEWDYSSIWTCYVVRIKLIKDTRFIFYYVRRVFRLHKTHQNQTVEEHCKLKIMDNCGKYAWLIFVNNKLENEQTMKLYVWPFVRWYHQSITSTCSGMVPLFVKTHQRSNSITLHPNSKAPLKEHSNPTNTFISCHTIALLIKTKFKLWKFW